MSKKNAKVRLDNLTKHVNQEVISILDELEGLSIKEIKMLISREGYEFNPTKCKLIEILKLDLNTRINEQILSGSEEII